MGRNWIPKFKVVCTNCGWKGVRGAISPPCPRCKMLPRTVVKVEDAILRAAEESAG